MELELLITELDQTTIQLDKINFLATRIMSIASEKTKHAKNALEYDFESQEIFKCSTILLDYVEMADTAIKKAVHELAVYDTELQKDIQKEARAETKAFITRLTQYIMPFQKTKRLNSNTISGT